MTIRSRLNSFKYAIEGLYYLLRKEPNAQLHFVATIGVIVLGIVRQIHATQWLYIMLAIAIVWIVEALNTAIEKLCDKYTTQYDADIKIIKDVSAGAVLVAALLSVGIAVCVFLM